MQIKARHYPHPVLSEFSESLVGCKFEADFQIIPSTSYYQLQTEFTLTSTDLANLVKSGKATYAVHIDCVGTRVRRLFQTHDDKLELDFPVQELDGRVEVCTFVLAAESFDYMNQDFHSYYEGHSFSVMKGDVLAVGPEFRFIPPKDMDPLVKVPSIFTVTVNTKTDAPDFDLDLSTPKVVIRLSQKNFALYQRLEKVPELQSILASLIILPALTSLLAEMQKQDAAELYEELNWYRVLQGKLKALNLNSADSILWMAQQIVGQPLLNALQATEHLILSTGGGNE